VSSCEEERSPRDVSENSAGRYDKKEKEIASRICDNISRLCGFCCDSEYVDIRSCSNTHIHSTMYTPGDVSCYYWQIGIVPEQAADMHSREPSTGEQAKVTRVEI
jgi:hypothetical protein